jgi:hypothetical protein
MSEQKKFLSWSIWLAVGIIACLLFARLFLKEPDGLVLSSHDNMNKLAVAVLEYKVDFGQFPDSLQQLSLVKLDKSRLLCPLTGLPYEYTKAGDNWQITSPAGHGSIKNGIADWE